MLRLLALSWLGLCCVACTYASGDPTVLVSSTPAGAEILLDGQETGRTTPSLLDLDGIIGSDHRITVRKDGYEPEHRDVVHYTHWYTSRWIDGTDFRLFALPLWWTLGDFVTPFAVRWQYQPHELHVTLHPEGQAPVQPGDTAPAAAFGASR